ncbi:MAG: restriction endonuclease subunit S [Lachnospiraceae bacterium]|nr:restriction endonuclease subunit S [Lachnospiraceae bacterium]
MANIPNIRFKGFTDAWEQRKLNEIAEKVTEKNKNNIYNEPLTNSAEMGIISQKDYFDREVVNEENLDGYYVVRDDDFVYNPRVSVTAPVGPINRNRLGRNGVMSPLYTIFRTHEINTLYLEYYFKTTKWHIFMKLNGDSGARFDRFTIATSQFMEMPIPYPYLEEQIKIGQYFDNLDHLITLHQCKCDETKELKKYMLQKMFPQNGKKIPEIRFAGFTDDWEQRKLEEVVNEFRSGVSLRADEIEVKGVYPVYGGNGLRGYTSTYNHDGEFALIGRQGALCGNMNYSVGKAYFTEHAVAVQADENNDTRFIYYLLDTMQLGQYSDQSAQPGLAVNKLIKLENMFPDKSEQVKISKYFANLDYLITLHQRKCDEFKEVKKFMLQNMFPQKG